MECKSKNGLPVWSALFELIDTLWNVNCRFNAFAQFVVSELIDTLWNVNSKKRSNQMALTRN